MTKMMHATKIVISIIMCLGFSISLIGQQRIIIPSTDTFIINRDTVIQTLPDLTWIIEENDTQLNPEDFQSGKIYDAEIITISNGDPVSVQGDKTYWYRLLLKSPTDMDNYKLSTNFSGGNGPFVHTHSFVETYHFTDSILIHKAITGFEIGISQRDIDEVMYPSLVRLRLRSNEVLEIWVKVKVGHSYPIQFINQIVSNQVNLSERYGPSSSSLFLGGILFTMFIIGIFLYYWFLEAVYLWFLAFLLINLFSWYTWNEGHDIIKYWFPEHPIYFNKLLSFGDMAKFIGTLILARVFINTKSNYPKIDRVFLSAIYIFFISVLCFLSLDTSAFHPWFWKILLFISLICILTFICVFFFFIFSQNKLARFYSLGAITPFLAMLFIMFSEQLGMAQFKDFIGQFIGLGPILALGLAMLYRFKIVNQERIKAEAKSRDILTNQNRILEEQVNERTAELSNSLENLKSTQAQLIQSEKMASLGELTAGIAHEIQNPLNFVNNFSEVSGELIDEMTDEIDKGDLEEVKALALDVKQNLEKINHHGKRADSIVKGMLEHSKSSSGKKALTDINALADEYLRLAYHGLRAKDSTFNADMQTDYDKSLPRIEVIPQDIGRVLLNLINNAFQAVQEKSHTETEGYQPMVKVSTQLTHSSQEGLPAGLAGAGGVLITISDNGPGIHDEIKDKIFQPFFTTKPTGQGTGLGLSLAYDIVKAHGGEIIVESNINHGTEFFVKITDTPKTNT